MALEILIYGAVLSAIYALLALGFTLVFGVARFINLTHGAFYTLGAYALFFATARLGLDYPLSLLLTLLFVTAAGLGLHRLVVVPLRGSLVGIMMVTLGLALFVQEVLTLLFSSQSQNVPMVVVANPVLLGVKVSGQRLFAGGLGFALVFALWALMRRSGVGRTLLAVAQDREAAALMGINIVRMDQLVIVISALLAALAGITASPFFTVVPSMGWMPMIKAFAIVILGGLGSIEGTVVASLILGYSEITTSFLISNSVTGLTPLVIILLVILIRPRGLMGTKTETLF